jgi:hypothetical protein
MMTNQRLKLHRGFYSQISVEQIQLLNLERSRTTLSEATKFITRIRLPVTNLYRRPHLLAKHIIDNLNGNEYPSTSSDIHLSHLRGSGAQRQSKRNDSNNFQSARSSAGTFYTARSSRSSAATFYTARSSRSSLMSFTTARSSTVSVAAERFTRLYV